MKKFIFMLLIILFSPNTTNAEVYKNQKYNFQITYPNHWEPYETNSEESYTAKNKSGGGYSVGADFIEGVEEDYTISNKSEKSIEQFLRYILNLDPHFTRIEYDTLETTIINGDVVMIAHSYTKKPSNGQYYSIYIIKNAKIYRFAMLSYNLDEENVNQFFDMVKSFRSLY